MHVLLMLGAVKWPLMPHYRGSWEETDQVLMELAVGLAMQHVDGDAEVSLGVVNDDAAGVP